MKKLLLVIMLFSSRSVFGMQDQEKAGIEYSVARLNAENKSLDFVDKVNFVRERFYAVLATGTCAGVCLLLKQNASALQILPVAALGGAVITHSLTKERRDQIRLQRDENNKELEVLKAQLASLALSLKDNKK